MIRGPCGATGRREGVSHPGRGGAVGRITEDRLDRAAQLGGIQPLETQPYPSSSGSDLLGDDRLIVAYRRDNQRKTMGESLTHGVVPAVAHHRGHMRQQG